MPPPVPLSTITPQSTPNEKVKQWIDAALAEGGSVLIHCSEGKSRSVTLAAAYCMMAGGADLAAALECIRYALLLRVAAADDDGDGAE